MERLGDMWRVEYPDDTRPLHAPVALEASETEAPAMVKDADFVYVDLYGNEVAADDPAAQTKYTAADLKTMRRGGFFAKRDGAAAPVEVEEAKGTPVLNSGLGAASEDDEDEKPVARHGKR